MILAERGVRMPDLLSRKFTIALIFAVIGMVLLLSSFILPWWGQHQIQDSYDVETGDKNYHNEFGYGIGVTSGLGFYGGGTTLYGGDYILPKIYIATTFLIIISIIFLFLLITTILLFQIDKIKNAKLPMIFGMMALIFCLIAPIIFMGALPGAMKTDAEKRAEEDGGKYEEPDHNDPTKSFFGNYEEVDEDEYDRDVRKLTWGGDIGWIMAFIAFAFILSSTVMVFQGYRSIRAPAAFKAPPPPQYQPPGQDYSRQYPTESPPVYPSSPPPPPPPPTQPPPYQYQQRPPDYPPRY
jgi:hypothetical protein